MRTFRHEATMHNRDRGGFLTPAVAVALLVVLAGIALALDSLWLDTATVELDAAAQAAAMAAARELADDDLLRQDSELATRLERAKRRALAIAKENQAVGTSVDLADDDVRFGVSVTDPDTGRKQLVSSDHFADTCMVTVHRTRGRSNPVALLLRGKQTGDVVRKSVAKIDNRIVGLRAGNDLAIPMLPLAILEEDAAGERTDTWQSAIENRAGGDQYGYDAETRSIVNKADGIPEIVLKTMAVDGEADESNVHLVDLNTDFSARRLIDQIDDGIPADDLKALDGELIDRGQPWEFISAARITDGVPEALLKHVGRCRVCLLYSARSGSGSDGYGQVLCRRIVACRVMAVRATGSDGYEIVVQPGVMTTAAAVLAAEDAGGRVAANRYVYKLQIVR